MLKNTALLAFLGLTQARTTDGSCPTDFEVVQNFDLAQYSGLWYEQARDSQTTFEYTAECVTATYSDNGDQDPTTITATYSDNGDQDPTTIKVYNRMTSYLLPWINLDATGTGYLPAGINEGSEGRIQVGFGDSDKFVKDPASLNYNVLDTDYTSYTIVYSCQDSTSWFGNPKRSEIMWVLTRDGKMSQSSIEALLEIGKAKT